MRIRRGFTIAAGVVTIALIVMAAMAAWSRSRIELRIADATERQAELRSELRRLQAALAEAERKGTTDAGESLEPVRAAIEGAPAFPPRSRSPGFMAYAREDPQLWNEFIMWKQAEYGRRYLPLSQRLDLSVSQYDRLKDILAAAVARNSDIAAAADAQGLESSDPAIVTLREQSEQQRNRELEELLGPAGFQQLEAYERALPVRGYADDLAVLVADTAPLSAEQADQLERVLVEAAEPYPNGTRANPERIDWDVVDRRVREILTPQQFAWWELGIAHNPMGGRSRRAQELKAVYEAAVKRMKENRQTSAQ